MLPKFEEEYVRMNVPNVEGGLTKDEVEAAQIYCVLVLRRIAGEEEEEEEVSEEESSNSDDEKAVDIVW